MALRRAKLLDGALAGLFLLVLSAVPVVARIGVRAGEYPRTTLQMTRVALAAAAWLPLFIAAVTLLLAWRSGRSTDKHFASTASPRGLACVQAALITKVIGCVLLAASLTASIADRDGVIGNLDWFVSIDAVGLAVSIWAAVSFGILFVEVRSARHMLRESPELDAGEVDPAHSTTEYPSSRF